MNRFGCNKGKVGILVGAVVAVVVLGRVLDALDETDIFFKGWEDFMGSFLILIFLDVEVGMVVDFVFFDITEGVAIFVVVVKFFVMVGVNVFKLFSLFKGVSFTTEVV